MQIKMKKWINIVTARRYKLVLKLEATCSDTISLYAAIKEKRRGNHMLTEMLNKTH